MNTHTSFDIPSPILDAKELEALDRITERYAKMTEPGVLAKLGEKAVQYIPDAIKKWGQDLKGTITEQELYEQIMKILVEGFKSIEEQAAKYSLNENQILKRINESLDNPKISTLDEVCLLRSYSIEKAVSKYKGQDLFAAAAEGGVIGAFGLWGLPFSIVLSTFLYFRAVQSIAMFYGYDVKNDDAELIIASEVFANALSPSNNEVNNEMTGIIGKIMAAGQVAAVKQGVKKGWSDMINRGGIPLLMAQMRALANKGVQKKLQQAGVKGLEGSLFKEVFEQIGRKLTLKSSGKVIPVFGVIVGALIDSAQMKQVLEFTDIFYQKRFSLEKELRINHLIGIEIIDAEFEETPSENDASPGK